MLIAENQDDPSSTPDLTENPDNDSESQTELYAMDLGLLLTKGSLQQLPRSQKFRLISHTPDDKYNYPATYMHSCNRRLGWTG